jgi:hypothetical protein
MIVTGHTRQWIATRSSTVEIGCASISPHPTYGVTVFRTRTSGTDTSSDVTRIATDRIMTT